MTQKLTEDLRRVIKNAFSLLVIQGVSYVVPLITVPFLVRKIGIEGFGILALSQAFAQYFQLFTDYGFNLYGPRQIALVNGDRGRLSSLLFSVVYAKTALLLMASCAYILIVCSFPRLRENWSVFGWSFLSVVGMTVTQQWYFQGIERIRALAGIYVLSRVLMTIILFCLVRDRRDILLAAALLASPMLLSGIVSWFLIARSRAVSFVRPTALEIRKSLKSGWPIFLSTVGINFYTTANLLLLGLVVPNKAFGEFAAADKVVGALKQVQPPLVNAVYPYVARASIDNSEALHPLLNRMAVIAAGVFAVPCLAMYVFAPQLTHLIFGQNSPRIAFLMRLMAALPLILVLVQVYVTLGLLAAGRLKEWSFVVNSTVLVNFLSLAALYFFVSAEAAVAITLCVDEAWVLGNGYLHWRREQKVGKA